MSMDDMSSQVQVTLEVYSLWHDPEWNSTDPLDATFMAQHANFWKPVYVFPEAVEKPTNLIDDARDSAYLANGGAYMPYFVALPNGNHGYFSLMQQYGKLESNGAAMGTIKTNVMMAKTLVVKVSNRGQWDMKWYPFDRRIVKLQLITRDNYAYRAQFVAMKVPERSDFVDQGFGVGGEANKCMAFSCDNYKASPFPLLTHY